MNSWAVFSWAPVKALACLQGTILVLRVAGRAAKVGVPSTPHERGTDFVAPQTSLDVYGNRSTADRMIEVEINHFPWNNQVSDKPPSERPH
jgi:hypothetical protein